MLRETTVYGASFHRAWYVRTGGVGIVDYAVGRLSGSTLTIEDVHRCDDESDVHVEIWSSGASAGASWGLDFPFSLPEAVYRDFALRDWPALVDFADNFEMTDLLGFLESGELFGPKEACRHPGDGCRITDAESGAFSPLKRYMPDRLEAAHGGLRLLGYLKRYRAAVVYPFDGPDRARASLYETYPAGTMDRLGLGKPLNPRDFIEAFNNLPGRAVEVAPLPDHFRGREYDLAAVVSCATLANAIRAFDLDESWDHRPAFATVPEWEMRQKEGLIVRL
jgi:hypothetical protein